MKIHNGYGIGLSLIFHFLLLLLPLSLVAPRQFKEMAIFIIGEEKQNPAIAKKISAAKEKKKEKLSSLATKKTFFQEPKRLSKSPEKIKESLLPENKPEIPETAAASCWQKTSSFASTPDFSPAAIPSATPQPEEEVDFGSLNGPKFLHQEIPRYPLLARRLGKEGRVVLRLTIDEAGNLLAVEVVEGAGFGFTEAAVAAIKKSTFLPAHRGNVSVKAKALLPIRFSLRR